MSEKTETNEELLADFPPSQSPTSEGERMVVAPYEGKRLDGVSITTTLVQDGEEKKRVANRSRTVSARTIPEELDDPKEYPPAPFSYQNSATENVGLNSGNLGLTISDFSLPGKNGFDLVLSRNYNSSMSNKNELTPEILKKDGYTWKLEFSFRGNDPDIGGNVTVKHTVSSNLGNYKTPTEARVAAEEWWDYHVVENEDFGIGMGIDYYNESTGDMHFCWIISNVYKKEVSSFYVGKVTSAVSATRPNNHLTNKYGLGLAWGFGFPSIEVVEEPYKKDSVRYYEFLHLGDGQVFKVKDGTLEDYELDDIIFSVSPGVVQNKTYHYSLQYKNGTTAYFLKESGNSVRLVAMVDKFDNMISFNLSQNGGTIVDTLGRTIFLSKAAIPSGYTLTWTLPDQNKIVYTVQNGLLTGVQDQAKHITTYIYGKYADDWDINFRKGSIFKSYADYEFGDDGVSIDYMPLTDVHHPSGAKSNYIYWFSERYRGGVLGGCQSYMTLVQRGDVESSGEIKFLEKYSYKFEWKSKDSGYNMQLYVNQAEKTMGVETDIFDFGYQAPLSKHVTRHNDMVVCERTIPSYQYKKLPTKEINKRFESGKTIQSESTWSYDAKGNLLTETLPLKGTTTMTYDSLYSLPLSQIYKKEGTTEIQETFTLRSDKKLVEWKKVFEKTGGASPILKEAVFYQYDRNFSTNTGSNNLISERQYAKISGNIPQATAADRIISYSYENTNSALDNATYSGVFLTKKWISGIRNADGVALPDSVEQYVCDAHGRVLKQTDPCANETKYTYDGLGRVVSETYPDGCSKEMKYVISAASNHLTEMEKDGKGAFVRGKRMEYTSLGKISNVYATNPDTKLSSYTYDNRNRLNSETTRSAERKTTTQYTYDAFDRVLSKATSGATSSASYQERFTYDDAFDPARLYTKETKEIVSSDSSAPSIVSSVLKDLMGRAVEESLGQAITKTTYNQIGNKISQTDPKMNTVSWAYDHAGRILSETRPHNAGKVTATTSYDCFGNTVKSTDFRGKGTILSYDVMGRLLEQKTDFNGTQKAIKRYAYNGVGNIISEKTLLSSGVFAETKHSYDKRYRLLDTILNDGKVETRVRQDYDSVGNKTAMYTGMLGASTVGAAKTTYTYDQFGNVTATTDPIGNSPAPSHLEKRTETYSYDNYGRLQNKKDRNGFVTTYRYDGLGRVLREEVVDSEGTMASSYKSFTWHKNALKATEENGEIKVSFRYDNMGRLTEQTETCRHGAANTVIKQYGYDLCGNRTSFRMSKDGVEQIPLTYGYDTQNRLLSVLKNGVKLAEYGYDANGNRASLVHPQSGLSTSYVYNDANLITQLSNKKDGAPRSSYDYSYYLNGNQSQKISKRGSATEQTTDYRYDLLGRLTEEKEQRGLVKQYAHDRFSNRSAMTVVDERGKTTVTDYTYDLRSRLLVETKKKDKTTEISNYSYDWNGNQVRREWEKFSPKKEKKAPGKAGFVSGKFGEDVVVLERREYNGYNQLIHLYRDTYETRYTYRPDGLRQQKIFADGTVLSHIWDGQNMVAEYGASGAISARYLRGVNLLCREQDNLLQYYQHNAHGDVVQRTDQRGTILKNYDYDAFGVEKNRETLDVNPFRYCGEYFDRESDTIYLRARSYDPGTGRFVGEDPIRSGLNWYTYCGNNPVGRTDPSGESWKSFWNDAKNFWNSSVASQSKRWDDMADSPSVIRFVDWMSYGVLSTNGARYNQVAVTGNAYDYANWLFSGIPDVLKGAVAPEEALSFNHWMSSFGAVSLIYGGYKGVQNIRANALPPLKNNIVKYNITDKISRQMESRGWSDKSINNITQNSYTIRDAINKATENAATVYYNQAGDYIVIDNITKDIVQVSRWGDSNWIPDSTIVNPYKPK